MNEPSDLRGSPIMLFVDEKLRVRLTAGETQAAGDDAPCGTALVEAMQAPGEKRQIERAAKLALSGQESELDIETGTLGSRRLRFVPIAGRFYGGRGVLVAVEPTEEELKTRVTDQAALRLAASRLARGIDADEVGGIVCETAAKVATSDFAAVVEPRDGGSTLSVTAAYGTEFARPLSVREEAALASEAFITGRQVFSDQLKRLSSGAPWPLNGAVAQAAIWQPVRREADVQAVIVVGWRRRIEVPDRRTKVALKLLADEASVALERAAAVERLAMMARTDPLTDLFNRRAWDDELVRELSRAGRAGERLSIGLIDIDDLKLVNDRQGHAAGDRLLSTAAARWQRRLRGTDVIARIGGDEFAMTLPSCSVTEAVVVGDELRGALPAGFTCSIGVAEWLPGESAESVLARADRALYAAKRSGGDRTEAAPAPNEVSA